MLHVGKKPEVFGVAKKMDRSGMKSKYCTIGATKAFETLINDIKAKYILLSYNNMAEKEIAVLMPRFPTMIL